MSQRLYLAFLALLLVERLVELVVSTRNARVQKARGAVEVGQGHFRVMTLLHALFVPACAAEVLLLHRPFPGALGFAALAVALCAQGLRWWAVLTLGTRWNVRVLAVPGDAPVVAGPYRFLRHPNYVAVIAELAAVPLVHGAWLCAVLFSAANAVLLRVRIRVEERALGPLYAQAFSDTPRLVPRA